MTGYERTGNRSAVTFTRAVRCLLAVSLLSLFVAAGCTAPEPESPTSDRSPSRSTAPTTGALCLESAGVATSQGTEIEGTTEVGELWALSGEPRVGEEHKIVIRASGESDLKAAALSPSGATLVPNSVEPHTASTFNRPGDEWGVFFTFNEPGCWRIEVDRGQLRGFFTLRVAPA